jgi:hypothetical protein
MLFLKKIHKLNMPQYKPAITVPCRLTLYHSRRSNMNDRCGGSGCMLIILFLAASSTVRAARTRSNATTLDETMRVRWHWYFTKRGTVIRSHMTAIVAYRNSCATIRGVSAGRRALVAIPSARQSPSPLESTIAYASVLWSKCERLQKNNKQASSVIYVPLVLPSLFDLCYFWILKCHGLV